MLTALTPQSSIDILRNLQDPEWIGKMKVCGQAERIWEAFQAARGDGDEASQDPSDLIS